MIVGMDAHQPRAILVERNPDGSLTKETLQRALKALKKRLCVSEFHQLSVWHGLSQQTRCRVYQPMFVSAHRRLFMK